MVITQPCPARRLRVWATGFPAQPETVGLARRHLLQRLSEWGWDGQRVDDLMMICSELVTNAVVHGSGPSDVVMVRLQEVDGGCRIEVSDTEPTLKFAKTAAVTGEGGRGLLLVNALADDFGVVKQREKGKTVWARVLRISDKGTDRGVAA
ncbi:hypothetical protein GCM10009760_16580 [Kitasatospora kazusensis]|uniref:Histidine kinase/HSP90-like ATPase domain-containing protein n=1 Tax=Kitasatospora kazusensis TaxID=407974 RepID=A0ABN2Z4X1_9ACTN